MLMRENMHRMKYCVYQTKSVLTVDEFVENRKRIVGGDDVIWNM